MKNYIILIIGFLISSCATSNDYEYGNPLDASHKVSLHELLGNSDWFDGEPIHVVGVADFNFDFESASGLYASESDLKNKTFAWVVLNLPLSGNNEKLMLDLQKLNGRFIEIQGVYHSIGRERLPSPKENGESEMIITICKGICGAAGSIDILSIRAWQ